MQHPTLKTKPLKSFSSVQVRTRRSEGRLWVTVNDELFWQFDLKGAIISEVEVSPVTGASFYRVGEAIGSISSSSCSVAGNTRWFGLWGITVDQPVRLIKVLHTHHDTQDEGMFFNFNRDDLGLRFDELSENGNSFKPLLRQCRYQQSGEHRYKPLPSEFGESNHHNRVFEARIFNSQASVKRGNAHGRLESGGTAATCSYCFCLVGNLGSSASP